MLKDFLSHILQSFCSLLRYLFLIFLWSRVVLDIYLGYICITVYCKFIGVYSADILVFVLSSNPLCPALGARSCLEMARSHMQSWQVAWTGCYF